MQSVPSWLWIAAEWCAVALGGWMLLTGRRRVRWRTARRCPRCRYDLNGLPSRTCPECAADHPELVELVITGDPIAAVDEYVLGTFNFESIAWNGHFHVKPRVERAPRIPVPDDLPVAARDSR